ncbi:MULTISPECIES: hypothetical protein [unclassified Lacrimispora]|uniref:hypothetical protein n=1 Tax=unclassified Lacrimispora TaxID=2719232 RepID=UPI0037703E40
MNNKGTLMKIVEVNSLADIVVEFQDEYHFRKNTMYINFKRGQVKNPYDITVYGVGMVGEGEYKTWEQGHITTEYSTWADMLRRCYSEKIKDKQLSYFGIVTVCNKWKVYQRFAEWYSSNKYEVNERLHLDKDILCPGNKLYSPDTCLLVPQRINMLLLNKPNKRGLPNGIRKVKNGYMAQYDQFELGIYNTVEEAYSYYAKEKEKKIIEVAEEYKNIIPKKVYDSLLKYRVNITYDQNYCIG